jgi:hypothetical protein
MISKMESPKIAIDKPPFDLETLIAETIQGLGRIRTILSVK